MKTKVKAQIRWMVEADMSQVLEIETTGGENKWSQEDILRRLARKDVIGCVCAAEDTVVGYVIYELHKDHLHILNFTVHPKYRRHSVGFHIMQKMKAKLSENRRTFLEMEIRESNLDGQLFLKKMGFSCDDIIKDWFDHGDEETPIYEDGYHFVYHLGE